MLFRSAYLREKIEETLAINNLLNNKTVISVPKKQFGEEIDVVFILGKTIFIGEAKCSIMPTSPVEINHYVKTLAKASSQIIRKKDFVLHNLSYMSKLLGISIDKTYDFAPVIISNTQLASGVSLNDAVVTEVDVITQYLKGKTKKHITDGLQDIPLKTIDISFYDSEEEAGKKVIEYLKNPIMLQQYSTSLKHISSIPKFNDQDFDIHEFDYISSFRDKDLDNAMSDLQKIEEGE